MSLAETTTRAAAVTTAAPAATMRRWEDTAAQGGDQCNNTYSFNDSTHRYFLMVTLALIVSVVSPPFNAESSCSGPILPPETTLNVFLSEPCSNA
jgi:hypothetical protein